MNLTITQSEVSQTIDAYAFLGDLAEIDSIRDSFAQDVIDHIVQRSQSGKSINNRGFKKYDEDYVESDTFRAYGKSTDVNMTLTGQMLDSVDVLESGGTSFKIGINDPSQAPKAYNHQVGDTLPKREWFGVRDAELQSLADKYIQEASTFEEPIYSAEDIFAAIRQTESSFEVDFAEDYD